MEDKDKLYNDLSNVVLINLFSLSKDNFKIVLKNFNRKDKNHLYMFEMAKICRNIFAREVYLDCGFFDFLFLKKKGDKVYRIKKKDITNEIDIQDFLFHISKANEIDDGVWSDIYDEWWNK